MAVPTIRSLIGVLALLLIAACASEGGYAEQFGPAAIPDSTSAFENTDMVITPGDRIEVDVFGIEELSDVYQVGSTGQVKFPLLGIMDAAGMAPDDFAASIEDGLRGRYLQNPDITVSIVESVGRRVTVEGSVEKPGVYPVVGDTSLLQVIAMAGGPGTNANLEKVVVFRTVEGRRMAAAFDLRKVRSGEQQDPRIYGNDVIILDGSEARRLYGGLLRAVPVIGLFRFF